ncbi:MAG TPA: hypothetical protein VGL25_15980 [Casimicrobiaceae bacterium]|jgi:hypothetical protein
MNDRDFVDAFESCTIASTDFHHADHVRLAWIYLREHPLIEAIERFTTSLQRFAAHHGVPGLYHETITWAYLLLIHERMQRDGMPKDWQSFQMANRDLFDRTPSVLDRYYTPATLNSELARRIFVMPDAIAGRQLT